MIRHLAELSALLLCFAVGVGLIAAFIVGLIMIWRPEFTTTAGEDEYRRVENVGLTWRPLMQVRAEITALPFDAYVSFAPRPYDWATREPMVWTVSHA